MQAWKTKKLKIENDYKELFTSLALESQQNEAQLKEYVKTKKQEIETKFKNLANKIVLVNSQNGQHSEFEKSTLIPWETKTSDKPMDETNFHNTNQYDSMLKELSDYDSQASQNIKSELGETTGLRNVMATMFGYDSLDKFYAVKDNKHETYIVPKEKLDEAKFNNGYAPYKVDNIGFHLRHLENYFIFGLDDNQNHGEKGDDLHSVNALISSLSSSLNGKNGIKTKKNEVKQRVTSFLPNILKDKHADINKIDDDFLYYFANYLNLAIIKHSLEHYTDTGLIPKKQMILNL